MGRVGKPETHIYLFFALARKAKFKDEKTFTHSFFYKPRTAALTPKSPASNQIGKNHGLF